ncbi:hypothetical protein D039_2343A, partial [Vibrio parahaemolyticus EKP-028]
MVFSV